MEIVGFVEFLDVSEVRGWAYDPERSDEHLEIVVSLDDLVLGTGVADAPRDDLSQLGFGAGDHGFSVRLEIAAAARDLDQVEVLARVANGELVRLSRVIGVDPAAEMPPPPPPKPLGIFPMPASEPRHRPVFVLGAARSGTSAVAQALLKCGVYEGFEEGHFLWLIRRFLLTVHKYYESNGDDAQPDRFTLLSRVPSSYLTGAVRAIFIAAMNEMFPNGLWLDKTPRPEMIEVAPLMRELWPNARFIFMKRRALENVSSRLTKLPTIGFREHCKDWVRSMQAWLLVRDLLGGAAIEIEQLAVARESDRVAAELGRFLELPDYAARRLARSFASDRPEQTTQEFAPVLRIDRLGWTDAMITEFREICGPMMAAYGYAYTDQYFAGPVNSIDVRTAG